MWSEHLLLGGVGLAGGLAVAAGSFAVIIMLGVVPRMIGKSRTAQEIMLYENMIILGAIAGNLLSVFLEISLDWGIFSRVFLGFYGLVTGVFVGALAAALEEVVQTFPIVSRRITLNAGASYIIVAMALGKMAGAFYYFWNQLSAG